MRETGWYWVRDSRGWTIASWDGDSEVWWVNGDHIPCGDEDFDKINEQRILNPDEIPTTN